MSSRKMPFVTIKQTLKALIHITLAFIFSYAIGHVFAVNRDERLAHFTSLYNMPSIVCRPILGAVSPHFKSDNGEIWREVANLGHPPLYIYV